MSEHGQEKSVEFKKKGDECFHSGNYQGAIHYYLKSLQIDPIYISAWNNLGLSFFKSGDREEAARCKERKEKLKTLHGDILPTQFESPIPDGRSPDESDTLRWIESLLQESTGDTIYGGESPEDSSTGMASPSPLDPVGDPPAVSEETPSGLFEWMKPRESDGGTIFPEAPATKQQTLQDVDLKGMIALSLFIGIVVFFGLFILEGGEQQYTQFYLVPDSVQSFNAQTNSGSFIYGVKSFEKDATSYELTVYAGNDLLEKKTFTLLPGQKIEEMISFQLKDPGFNQTQVNLFLKFSNSTHALHYWIKK